MSRAPGSSGAAEALATATATVAATATRHVHLADAGRRLGVDRGSDGDIDMATRAGGSMDGRVDGRADGVVERHQPRHRRGLRHAANTATL